ncbi:hypothetical protein [Enterococcus casseliflavus]|uniref:hypothetical protein n=1 Tax=Enterococcus casseliflavus TaxID=37734 RepID=UPI0028900EAF|nr:hypothetical protein [Enterococcus casseliflavus]MDT2961623.1 hypothetical protein [Enterococcus casseliflavus]
MQVTLARTIEVKQAWMAKDEAVIYFGYQNHKSLFQKLLREFKEHKDFKDGYRLVTSNLPIINIQLFDEFLVWRTSNKYKR